MKNPMESSRRQRIVEDLKEKHPLQAIAELTYRLDRLEEKLEDYSSGDFDRLHSRITDMTRALERFFDQLQGSIDDLEERVHQLEGEEIDRLEQSERSEGPPALGKNTS